jgi:hypothetical protein
MKELRQYTWKSNPESGKVYVEISIFDLYNGEAAYTIEKLPARSYERSYHGKFYVKDFSIALNRADRWMAKFPELKFSMTEFVKREA